MMEKVFISTPGKGIARAERSTQGNWSVEFHLNGKDVRCVAANPQNPMVVYAGVNEEGVYRSEDRGKTWQFAGLQEKAIRFLAVSPTRRGTLYAGTMPAHLYVSHDEGKTWEEIESFREVPGRWLWFSPAESPWKAYPMGIALSPTDPDIINVGIEFGATLHSQDGGKSWSGHKNGSLRDCHSLIAHPANGDWVYEAGGSGGGTAVSQDGGRTWTKTGNKLDRHYGWACAGDPAQPEIWYASLSTGPNKAHSWDDAQAYIYRFEGTNSWKRLEGGLPQPLDHMPYALMPDPEAPGHLYAGLSNGDVWHTQDHGDHWEKLGVSLTGVHRSMVMI